ncbi:DNA cytosine methyltransferase [Candidimonas humi]|uniref:DNA cytosine methyltransferase n=1 Tax=Candidimonas humi TaxID=683355 RepID=A0ABV8NXN3_9BURK|nr:DNA cytosine methyltransferase [Candidimonas humi]MBV6304910.1 DNA cytosine methyltransferase [Candidimonas humi]
MNTSVIKHFHLFCGSGSGAAGFNDARPEIPGLQGKMICLGGMDVDPVGAEDFHMLTGVRCTVRDLFSRQQYVAWHGDEPPAGWVEAMPADVRAAAQHQVPDIVFLSAPCKGFSGLLPAAHAKSRRYQALNELTLRGVWLMLEAWASDPVPVILFENVPRIATRGRHLLDQITSMLRHYGYVVRETTHDCGELGNLAQSRKRFLLIARHAEKVPPFIYEPPKRPLRAVGEVLGRMHLPGDLVAGPMHRIPSLSWKTWVRLAFVEAGSDWRSLNKLAVENGHLRDYLIVPEYRRGYLGANAWTEPCGTVQGESLPSNGKFSVADPRFGPSAAWKDGQAYGVRRWDDTSGAISGVKSPGQGSFSVADPRHQGPAKHSNEYRIVAWNHAAQAVTSAHGSGQCVADPRRAGPTFGKYAVTGWQDPAGTVIAGSTTGQGAYAVADPRSGMRRAQGDNYLTGGHYGVIDWRQPSGAVSASACHDNGRWSVADPRRMLAPDDKLTCHIIRLDGTWHRPFTTLELAALQGIYDPDDYAEVAEPFQMHGSSDQVLREHIGNAVPRPAARAIGTEIGRTILLARTGETFQLSSTPIWVRPVAEAIAVRGGEAA